MRLKLSEDQARIVLNAGGQIEVLDERGRVVGRLTPLSAEDIEMIEYCKQRRANPGKKIPSEQVTAHLQRLAEIAKTKTLDAEMVRDLIHRMQAGESV